MLKMCPENRAKHTEMKCRSVKIKNQKIIPGDPTPN